MGSCTTTTTPFANKELMNLNFDPYNFGEFAYATIAQANHVKYKTITTLELPQATALPDGRNILSQIQFQ
jgi:hypothetical protein